MEIYKKFPVTLSSEAENELKQIEGVERDVIVGDNVSEDGYKTKGVLILGLNPAGDETTAKEERETGYFYLYYVPRLYKVTRDKLTERTNGTYYGAIWDFVNRITKDNAKWDWQNYSQTTLESLLRADPINYSDEDIDEILKFYHNRKDKEHDRKDKEYTIYIDDLFNYHKTKQSEFEKLIGLSNNVIWHSYIKNVLDSIIYKYEKAGVDLKMIYVNNSFASQLICGAINGGNYATKIDYRLNGKTYHIFLGGMLSGGRAMDVFSRMRLENEITDNKIF